MSVQDHVHRATQEPSKQELAKALADLLFASFIADNGLTEAQQRALSLLDRYPKAGNEHKE